MDMGFTPGFIRPGQSPEFRPIIEPIFRPPHQPGPGRVTAPILGLPGFGPPFGLPGFGPPNIGPKPGFGGYVPPGFRPPHFRPPIGPPGLGGGGGGGGGGGIIPAPIPAPGGGGGGVPAPIPGPGAGQGAPVVLGGAGLPPMLTGGDTLGQITIPGVNTGLAAQQARFAQMRQAALGRIMALLFGGG